MPELPEVETVCRELREIAKDHGRIEAVEIGRHNLRKPMPRTQLKALVGERVRAVRRRAKYILIDTDTSTIINHLGMTGSWRKAPAGSEMKHDHLYLSIGEYGRLAFHDPRRFGLLAVVKRGQAERSRWLANLGPEPLEDAEFSEAYFWQKTRKRSTPIKSFLMDQKIVVGVGNIYASEALHFAGIRPTRPAARLSREQCSRLVNEVKAILQKAIAAGGTTIRDYRQASGNEGQFQSALQVYGRKGEACHVCGTKIKNAVLAGRSTFWCPSCQR